MFRRRRKDDPIPRGEIRSVLDERVALWHDLARGDRERLLARMGPFVSGRRWEGVGVDVDRRIQIVVGAHAQIMALGFDRDPFDDVTSIVVYPTTVVRRGSRQLGGGVAATGPLAIHGETVRGGPVVLVWRAIDTGSRHPERGRNVAIHEFAHRLDLVDGVVDGMPPLPSRTDELAWQRVLGDAYDRLVAEIDPFLGRYASTNHGELFAVASERFFTRPAELAARFPELYGALRGFYRQDPIERRPT